MKFKEHWKQASKVVAGTVAAVVGVAGSALAGLDSAQVNEIKTGIQGADTNYFLIGGAVLVVLAGIWGFKMIKQLIR